MLIGTFEDPFRAWDAVTTNTLASLQWDKLDSDDRTRDLKEARLPVV